MKITFAPGGQVEVRRIDHWATNPRNEAVRAFLEALRKDMDFF